MGQFSQNTYKGLQISHNRSSNPYVTGRMKGKGEEELGRDLHVWARAVEERSLGRSLLWGRRIGRDREGGGWSWPTALKGTDGPPRKVLAASPHFQPETRTCWRARPLGAGETRGGTQPGCAGTAPRVRRGVRPQPLVRLGRRGCRPQGRLAVPLRCGDALAVFPTRTAGVRAPEGLWATRGLQGRSSSGLHAGGLLSVP